MDSGRLLQSVQKGEGCKLRSYQDTEKVWTIGWGRNVQTMKISQELADAWLIEDLKTAVVSAKMFPEWAALDTDARQNAFVEMVFNLGPLRFGGFKNMRAAIAAKDWETVAEEGKDSKWFTQVGKRAVRLLEMFRTGQFV